MTDDTPRDPRDPTPRLPRVWALRVEGTRNIKPARAIRRASAFFTDEAFDLTRSAQVVKLLRAAQGPVLLGEVPLMYDPQNVLDVLAPYIVAEVRLPDDPGYDPSTEQPDVPEDAEQPDSDGDPFVPWRLATVQLAHAGGNPTKAHVACLQMAHAFHDDPRGLDFLRAADALMSVFGQEDGS